MFEWFRRIFDRFQVTVVKSHEPPADMSGRKALRLHQFQQTGKFMVVSQKAVEPPAGSYAFHEVNIWTDSTVAWGGKFEDVSYGPPQPVDPSDVRRNGHLYVPIGFTSNPDPVQAKSFRVHLYHTLAGTIAPPLELDDEIMAVANWWWQELIAVTRKGMIFQFRCQDRPDGTFELALQAQDDGLKQLLSRPIVRANILGPKDILIEVESGETTRDRWPANRLLWFLFGGLYGQPDVDADNEILGRHFWSFSWRSDSAAPTENRLVLSRTWTPLFMFFFPQTGGSKWQRFKCTGEGARDDEGYGAGGPCDVAVFGGPYQGGPIWLVHIRWIEKVVEVLRIVPNVGNKTFSVQKVWERATDKRVVDVRWYDQNGKQRYVALFEDGTLEIVWREHALQRVVDAFG